MTSHRDPEEQRGGAARRARRTALGVLVGATALTAVTLFLTARNLGGGEEARVAAATNTVVVLPDGTVDAVDPGTAVPAGSRIVTLQDGRVVAGDVELGPNREAVVDEGALRPSPTTAPPPPPVTQPPATTPPPSGPTTDPPGGTVASLALEAVHKETTVRLRWSPYRGDGFAAYLVLRADAPHPARYPVDEHTTVVARITDPGAVQYFDAAREPAGRSYRVVAVDGDRRLLARSPAVRPQPATGDLRSTSTTDGTGAIQVPSATAPGVEPVTTRD